MSLRSNEACNTSLGIMSAFIGATQAFPKTKASSVLVHLSVDIFARKKATALKTSCELSSNN